MSDPMTRDVARATQGVVFLLLLGCLAAVAAWSNVWLAPAALIGAALGFALQRGRFSAPSILGSLLLGPDRKPVAAAGLAIFVSMIGLGAITSYAHVDHLEPITYPRIYVVTAAVGGVIFGSGMALAGGCVSGSLFKAAEGRLTSMLAVVGIAIG